MKKETKWLLGAGALLAAAAAAVYFWQRSKKDGEARPPAQAPQLDLEHPASQEEFPTAPKESEVG